MQARIRLPCPAPLPPPGYIFPCQGEHGRPRAPALACLLPCAFALRPSACGLVPSPLQVKAHPFFASVNWETLANDEVSLRLVDAPHLVCPSQHTPAASHAQAA